MKYDMTQLQELLENLMLETTIGRRSDEGEGKTFQVRASELPLVSLRKCLTYGFQRWANDRVGGSDTTLQQKIDDTSIYLAKIIDGSWVEEARGAGSPGVSPETRIGREVVRKWLAANKPEALKGKKGDEATAFFDKVLAGNAEAFKEAIDAAIAAERAKVAGIKAINVEIKL